MLFKWMSIAFWIIAIAALIWILSKRRLRKKYGIFSIVFAALVMGIIAAAFIFLAYLAIIFLIVIAILVAAAIVINFLFKKKR